MNLINELPNSVSDVSSMLLAGFFISNQDWASAIEVCHKNIYELLCEMQHQANLLARAYMRNGDYEKAEIICYTKGAKEVQTNGKLKQNLQQNANG